MNNISKKNNDSNDSLSSISWRSFDSRSNSLDSNSSTISNIMDFYKDNKDNKDDNKDNDDIPVKKKLKMAFEKPRRKREMNINYVLSKSPQISDALNIIEKGKNRIPPYNIGNDYILHDFKNE